MSAPAGSSPFQGLFDLSSLTTPNATQAALISAILQSSGSAFPTMGGNSNINNQDSASQLNSMLASQALAAVFQATATALTNGTLNVNTAALEGLAAGNNGDQSHKSADEVDGSLLGGNSHSHLAAQLTRQLPQSSASSGGQECANCGNVSSTTQLRRYGNIAHYLCAKCGNGAAAAVANAMNALAAATSSPGRPPINVRPPATLKPTIVTLPNTTVMPKRKNSDTNSSDGEMNSYNSPSSMLTSTISTGGSSTSTNTPGRRAHSGRKVCCENFVFYVKRLLMFSI